MSDVPINDDIVLLGDAAYLKEDESGEIIIDPYPTQGSQNAVQSGGTFEVIDGINYVLGNAHLRSLTNQRHLQVTNCTNVCEITLVTQVINGVTLTLRDDDTFTVNGTASANIQLKVGIVHCTANDYIYPYFRIIGCPPDSSGSLKVIREGNSSTSTVATDTGEGARFCTYEDESLKKGYIYNLYFACPSGATFSNKRFIPMAYATFYNAGAPDADEEYFYGFKTPFSKSNEDLTREQDRLQPAEKNFGGTTNEDFCVGGFTSRFYTSDGVSGRTYIANQPTEYGFLLTASRSDGDNELHQIWCEQNNANNDHLYHRSLNGNNLVSDVPFKAILDSYGGELNNVKGVLHKIPTAGMWIKDRESPLVKTDTMPNTTGYIAIASMKVADGTWSIGVLNKDLYLCYVKDSDYNSNNNVAYKYKFSPPSAQEVSFLPLSGGTLTGNLKTAGTDLEFGTTGSSSNDSGDLLWRYGNGNEKMRIWTDNTYSGASGPNYRVYNSNGTALYSGKLSIRDDIVRERYSVTVNGVTNSSAKQFAFGAKTKSGYKPIGYGSLAYNYSSDVVAALESVSITDTTITMYGYAKRWASGSCNVTFFIDVLWRLN